MKLNQKPPQIPFIRELCAHLPDDEIEAAEARFMRYVAVCKGIAESVIDKEKEEGFDKKQDHP